MIIEKIKDKELRDRLLLVRDGFPRDINTVEVEPDLYRFPDDDMAYLPMDRIIDINQAVTAPEEQVLPSSALEHFIRTASHRCIMNFCICRESMECKDYPVEMGCLFLGDAAGKVHPELGRQVSVEEALRYAEDCRKAGLIHLVGRDKLDILWLEVGPEEKLMTVCNCCPCCCLHRVAVKMPGEAGKKVSKLPGIFVRVLDNCIGCGTCVEENICIFNAIKLEDDRAVINDDQCRACGRCVDNCPEDAIELVIDDPGYIKNAIEYFSKIVDYR